MYDLILFGRPTGNQFQEKILTPIASNWRRSSLAVGGFWEGSFTIKDQPRSEITNYFDQWIGYHLVERSFGKRSWEGIIWQMDLLLDGINYRRSLDVEWWANRVKAVYSYPTVEDTNQGVLSFDGATRLEDLGQDFSDWETAVLAAPAAYRINIFCDDASTRNAFIGPASGVGDTKFTAYQDEMLTQAGFGVAIAGLTPISYTISNVLLSGKRQETDWAQSDASVELYGQREYVLTLPGMYPTAAASMRDRSLTEYAWPRSNMTGSDIVIGKTRPREATLEVIVKGFWHTLDWRNEETSLVGTTSGLISTLIGSAEFVSAGRIETNADKSFVDCSLAPQGIGSLIEVLISQGDTSGNMWQGGVYEDKGFIYEMAPTTPAYKLQDGQLLDMGNDIVIPTLLKPGFLLRNADAPGGSQPPGTSDLWNNPQIVYVEEVEFEAPDILRLSLADASDSIAILVRRMEMGL